MMDEPFEYEESALDADKSAADDVASASFEVEPAFDPDALSEIDAMVSPVLDVECEAAPDVDYGAEFSPEVGGDPDADVEPALEPLDEPASEGFDDDELQALGPPSIPEPDASEFGEEDAGDIYTAPVGVADQPVPRITIGAFCETPASAALIETASEDRRMLRAHVDVEMGGLPAAIQRFHDDPTPNLIIVETGMRGTGLFEQLDELANVCDPGTKLIIVGAANDIGLYRELMRRGVSEYLVPPMTPVSFIRAVAALYVDPDEPFQGKTIAFIGAKGGVGSSTIAHNIAWCIAEKAEIDSTIVDLDLSFGTAGLDFNQDAMQGVAEALQSPERVDDVLLDRLVTRCTERLTLFSAPATLDQDWDVGPEDYEIVVEAISKTVPMIILDLPHTWAPWVRRALLSADEVVVTAVPDLASLRNTKNIVDLVKASRPNDAPPRIILNQVGVPKRPEIPVKDFAEAVGAQPDVVLPFDPAVFGTAANNGQMLPELKTESKAVDAVVQIALDIAGREAPTRKTSFLNKLLKRG